MTRFEFDRRGDIKGDPRHAHVTYYHDGRSMLGEVWDQYRDEDGTIRLKVSFLNRECWPVDPPAGCVHVLERTYDEPDPTE